MPYRGLIPFAACALVACASGPHPALKVAANDLGCEQSGLKLHELYPKKVRVEGCGKEATYVDACDGYGIEANCGWGRYYATDFERAAAKQEKAERKVAEAQQAEEKRAQRERTAQEKAEHAAAERENAEQEKIAKGEQEKAEQEKAEQEKAEQEKAEQEDEKATAKKADDEQGDDDEGKADSKKPEGKATKRGKKKDEGIEAFLK